MFYKDHAPPHFHAKYGEYEWSTEHDTKSKKAEYVKNHIIKVRFADGIEGEVNFAGELDGEIFEWR